MTDKELLQQVLDAWQDHWVNDHQSALLEMIRANCANCARCGEENPAEIHTCTPQREWQGLTDEEVLADDVLRYHFGLNGGAGPVSKKGKAVIEAIEAKLKEKNHG